MPSIVATPGAGDANSYVTLAFADDFFDRELRGDAWAAFDNTQKERALIQATRQIEGLRIDGVREDTTTPQALLFPRAQDPERSAFHESFTSDFGVAVQLDQVEITASSEIVEDAAGTEYTSATDYTLDGDAGTITVLATGTMSDATEYLISYGYNGIISEVEHATCEQAFDLLEATQGSDTDIPVDHKELQAAGVKSFTMDGIGVNYEGSGGSELCPAAQALLEKYIVRTGRIATRGWGDGRA